EPVRCRVSAFKKTRAPTASSSKGELTSGVLTATPARRFLAASISVAVGRMVLSTAPMIGKGTPETGVLSCTALPCDPPALSEFFCSRCVHSQAGAKSCDPASAASRFCHMVEEYPRALGPGHAERELAAFIPRAIECIKTCAPQVVVENADRCFAYNVPRCGRRECGDRHAACQRFQQHQTEGICAAGKDEHIGSGVDFGQSLAMHRSQEHGIRKFSRESTPRRAVSNDYLGAQQIELQKRFQIFFYR